MSSIEWIYKLYLLQEFQNPKFSGIFEAKRADFANSTKRTWNFIKWGASVSGRVGSNQVGSTCGTHIVHPNLNPTRFRNGSGLEKPYPLQVGSGRPVLTCVVPNSLRVFFYLFLIEWDLENEIHLGWDIMWCGLRVRIRMALVFEIFKNRISKWEWPNGISYIPFLLSPKKNIPFLFGFTY